MFSEFALKINVKAALVLKLLAETANINENINDLLRCIYNFKQSFNLQDY